MEDNKVERLHGDILDIKEVANLFRENFNIPHEKAVELAVSYHRTLVLEVAIKFNLLKH